MENKEQIFTKVYDDNIDSIYRFIFLKVNSQDVAQDLCSEAFTRVWRRFDSVDNPKAFLYQIARNLVIDHYREKGKSQIVEIENVPIIDDRTDLEGKSYQNSDLSIIMSALKNIKPEYADIITYHYVNDLTVEEISNIVDKSENNIRVILHRGLKSIRSQLGGRYSS